MIDFIYCHWGMVSKLVSNKSWLPRLVTKENALLCVTLSVTTWLTAIGEQGSEQGNSPFIGSQYAGKYAPNEPLLNANFTHLLRTKTAFCECAKRNT